MSKAITASTKNKPRRGRPPTTGKGVLIGGRWQSPDVDAIDAWRDQQEDKPDRAEAVRRLVRLGLERPANKPKRRP